MIDVEATTQLSNKEVGSDVINELKIEADGYSKSKLNSKVKREGFVHRSVDGQQSFKNVSREYLLKHNG